MTINLAEEAFIDAIVASMKVQAEIIPLARKLNDLMTKVSQANEAVLRDQGITEDSALEDVLDNQRYYMNAAIERSGFPESDPVVKGLRNQLQEMEEAFRAMSMAAEAELGKIQGPSL